MQTGSTLVCLRNFAGFVRVTCSPKIKLVHVKSDFSVYHAPLGGGGVMRKGSFGEEQISGILKQSVRAASPPLGSSVRTVS